MIDIHLVYSWSQLRIQKRLQKVQNKKKKILYELLEKHSKAREKGFDEYQELAERESIKIKTKVIFGNPGQEIVKFSLKDEFDVIIIGNRGIGHLKEMIIGSVSSTVIHDAKCPVLLVK